LNACFLAQGISAQDRLDTGKQPLGVWAIHKKRRFAWPDFVSVELSELASIYCFDQSVLNGCEVALLVNMFWQAGAVEINEDGLLRTTRLFVTGGRGGRAISSEESLEETHVRVS
jgi:hypothetical protein